MRLMDTLRRIWRNGAPPAPTRGRRITCTEPLPLTSAVERARIEARYKAIERLLVDQLAKRRETP